MILDSPYSDRRISPRVLAAKQKNMIIDKFDSKSSPQFMITNGDTLAI